MLRAQAIWWTVELASKVFNCADVGTCGIVGVIAMLEFLEHHFPKSGHPGNYPTCLAPLCKLQFTRSLFYWAEQGCGLHSGSPWWASTVSPQPVAM